MSRRQAQKIYLDSRFSNEDGSIDLLNNGITCHPQNRCWLTEFSSVASWWTVDSSNDVLFVREKIAPGSWHNRQVAISNGPYDMDSLATEIAARLNGPGKHVGMGTYTCTRVSGAIGGGGTGNTQRCYAIAVSVGEFQLPSEAAIRANFDIPEHRLTNSTNFLFSFADGNTDSSTHTSGLVDLRRAHNLYIHTPGFGSYSCLGPRGSSNILAKIAVDVGYGMPLYNRFVATELDGVEVGVHAVNRLKLEIRDVFGNVIDMRGGHWSATMVFEE